MANKISSALAFFFFFFNTLLGNIYLLLSKQFCSKSLATGIYIWQMEYTEKHAAHKFGLTGAEGFQRKGEMLPKKKKKGERN